ncbi:TPA: aspartate--tRNA ligase [Candidatus Woesearchaeota archaeon]|nr:MAG: aspartyl-tRNA synthetase [archaeon GW2011_AR16]HIG95923.1 aspartate--tRNA ligase [Candidatus Woesearchaeota archaeon]HII89014.1 aspartate--tRNA ligase [Candidatus Woesearchaeota archaeon]
MAKKTETAKDTSKSATHATHATSPLATSLRTHTCGELTGKDDKAIVTVCGWVNTRRDHGGVIFVDLRDRYGITQVVFNPGTPGFDQAEHLRREDCLQLTGKVRPRPKGMANSNLKTGEIEVVSEKLVMLNKSDVPPLEVDDNVVANEDIRLQYRYLDLRRPLMQKRLQIRHTAAQTARAFMSSQGFLEIETPILVKSTPEGARDYIVPSRVNPGKCYALPQSPQLYKQILMVSGCDRYFQLARCLRDEDLRVDRQPEHTQIDIEMSYVQIQDIHRVVEGLLKSIWKATLNSELKTPFPTIKHEEAMLKYGTDKPDIRYELFLHDVTDLAKESDFQVFKTVVQSGGIVKCLAGPKQLSRNDIDKYIAFSQQLGAKGLAWMRVTNGKLESNIAKFFSEELQKKLVKQTQAKEGEVLMFIADKIKLTNQVLDKIRQDIAQQHKLFDPKTFVFTWITDFPLFEWNEEEEKWDPAHHPFCMPNESEIKYLETDPGKVYCTQYDLVLNGTELGSGSIRINRPDIQERVMKVIGLTQKDLERKFKFLLEAFKYGAPPHGGMGLGFDRIVALICGTTDIREVIAFPKNKAAECPMDESPSDIEAKQLKELHIKLDVVKK